ncbi:phosphonate metabolism protein/1,5-bisphosphokinase (PRPP-forming) PhnN [Ancylobacter sp. 6x-1]|uniref:Ribose 1,5-bisphosphate phosphokinase PhnN n=1 Tax=Ancylobacter crimeensis TaxID=2579147 RepID=A0ABT0D9M8_9HYPH|nr:phosphonate metabolism protein/1,5-bisphosphokinase (PRPP-forming) PhnN [Ancylobacter crimeensis]MCK0196647.1 phosphonate metabolism protein/1,5-bisphosphokinase (PRPP-forming) PhnN [Ancylobacter crimeensis]
MTKCEAVESGTLDEVRSEAEIRNGTLVFVVGPSGAGKDTLLNHARAHFARRPAGRSVVFARRLITRPADATEDHCEIGPDAFEAGVSGDRFALSWRANGLGYALGPECREWLAAGRVVAANGSRAAVTQAVARFADVRVVLVTAPAEVLAMRLASRGRETAGDVLARLKRAPSLDVAPALTIMNDGEIAAAGETLIGYLSTL